MSKTDTTAYLSRHSSIGSNIKLVALMSSFQLIRLINSFIKSTSTQTIANALSKYGAEETEPCEKIFRIERIEMQSKWNWILSGLEADRSRIGKMFNFMIFKTVYIKSVNI